jgi:hypothetical protein
LRAFAARFGTSSGTKEVLLINFRYSGHPGSVLVVGYDLVLCRGAFIRRLLGAAGPFTQILNLWGKLVTNGFDLSLGILF